MVKKQTSEINRNIAKTNSWKGRKKFVLKIEFLLQEGRGQVEKQTSQKNRKTEKLKF